MRSYWMSLGLGAPHFDRLGQKNGSPRCLGYHFVQNWLYCTIPIHKQPRDITNMLLILNITIGMYPLIGSFNRYSLCSTFILNNLLAGELML
uniref:Uncharacterized protein n=1 Tax=Anguilla anguilla TaxID=7936 RepID=A0A0E9SWV3_ANGAN